MVWVVNSAACAAVQAGCRRRGGSRKRVGHRILHLRLYGGVQQRWVDVSCWSVRRSRAGWMMYRLGKVFRFSDIVARIQFNTLAHLFRPVLRLRVNSIC